MSPLAIELASGSVWETGSAEMLGLKLLFSREKVFVTGMYTPIQKRPSAFCLHIFWTFSHPLLTV
jgi:hypothetical protein